jgi:hypothetical protein
MPYINKINKDKLIKEIIINNNINNNITNLKIIFLSILSSIGVPY